MKKSFLALTLLAFSVSPAAFGGGITAEQIYKTAYVELKQGKDSAQVLNNLLGTVAANKIDMKDVLAAAVARGWMSQQQMSAALETAAKYAYLAKDGKFVEKAKAGQFDASDMQAFAAAMEGQVTGAAYHCGYYGCYRHYYVTPFGVLLLLLLFTPVIIVSG